MLTFSLRPPSSISKIYGLKNFLWHQNFHLMENNILPITLYLKNIFVLFKRHEGLSVIEYGQHFTKLTKMFDRFF